MWASLAIFTPDQGFDMDNAIAHITQVVAVIVQTSNIDVAILQCLHHSWVAVFAIQRGAGENNLLKAASFTRGLSPVKLVESRWFRRASHRTREDLPFARIALGDIVTVRTINSLSENSKKQKTLYSSSNNQDELPCWKKQEKLSDTCRAILGAYFECYKGIYSCSFYDSMDFKQIIAIAVWDTFESASFVANHPETNPALPYWERIAGAQQLKHHIYEVVYVNHCNDPAESSSVPAFQI